MIPEARGNSDSFSFFTWRVQIVLNGLGQGQEAFVRWSSGSSRLKGLLAHGRFGAISRSSTVAEFARCYYKDVTEPPVFFLPYCPSEKQEEIYTHIASKVERPVPCLGDRVYSISFDHDGTLWTATVGQCLTGRKQVWEKRKKTGRCTTVEDPATVLAIFPDDPYCIVTDLNPGSHFGNPFYAGVPIGIEYFFWPRRHN